MAELKSAKNAASVAAFLDAIEDDAKQRDARTVDRLMREVSGDAPAMYGANIVGYGRQTVTYANGKTMDWMRIGFSPRKQAMTLYLGGFDRHAALLATLGKHSTGKGCLYVKKLADVDTDVLRQLIEAAFQARPDTA